MNEFRKWCPALRPTKLHGNAEDKVIFAILQPAISNHSVSALKDSSNDMLLVSDMYNVLDSWRTSTQLYYNREDRLTVGYQWACRSPADILKRLDSDFDKLNILLVVFNHWFVTQTAFDSLLPVASRIWRAFRPCMGIVLWFGLNMALWSHKFRSLKQGDLPFNCFQTSGSPIEICFLLVDIRS